MTFQAGQKITAADLNRAAPSTSTQLTNISDTGTLTSAVYTDTLSGAINATLAFVTPPSGSIEVTIHAAIDNSSTNYTYVSFRISGAAGTVAASDDYAISANGTDDHTASRTTIIPGLTPGAAGTITMQYRVSAGTGTVDHRSIIQKPMPG
ncbi:hypothetical protein [Umezawaea tangerina]|uniref:Uncharacterized protein n=1 Tax=Umezawaea tangerina TaxID=84725 RepID=A0A2T0SPJ5_9PSEU|nr:hypothetical protein [Umezawaea tangerina]PRY35330.1 hypothetical protein CLV43_114248 [Umezawaea tangerina]